MGTFTNTGGTFASDATVGAVAITSPSNAQLSDNAYATSVLLITQISNYLKATNFNFTIPTDATITGITATIERSSNTISGTKDSSVKLVKGGAISGNDKADTSTLWPTSDGTVTYGSSSDLWGLSLAPSDINSSGFGVCIAAVASLASTAQIDQVMLTVDYTGSNRSASTSPHVSTGNGISRNEVAS